MYQKGAKGWFKHFDFMVLDMACLQLAFFLAYTVRNGLSNPYLNPIYRNMAIFLEVTDLALLACSGTLKNVLKRENTRGLVETIKHGVIVELLAVLFLFSLQEGENYSRIVLYLTGVIYVILTYAVRVAWKGSLKQRMQDGGKRSLLIVADKADAPVVVQNVMQRNYEMFTIVGVSILGGDSYEKDILGIPALKMDGAAENFVRREWIDEVLVVPSRELPYPKELIDKLMETGVTVHIDLIGDHHMAGEKQLVENIGGYTVLTNSINYATTEQAAIKRAIDILGGLAGCILTGILFIFVAPAIYISSPGPIFFAQERVGKNGKKFKMYKFRSMYLDAEERKAALMKDNRIGDGMMFKLDFDPRIIGNRILPDGTRKTGIGNFIRVTSIDEFPQFFNVLKGDMSLVGTRPPTLDEWAMYDLHHRARLAAKPGITGMWQVSGRSEVTDFEDVVKLDMKYIRDWTIGLDFKILIKTVKVVLKRDGSM